MRLPVDIMRSFRFRILALVLSLVTAVVSATVVAVVTKAHAEVGRQAAQKLRSAADTAREVLKFRGNQLTSAVEVLTSDFGFKEAIAFGHTATLISALANHRSRIGADVLIVLNPEGQVVASTLATLSARTHADLQSLVAGDTDGQLMRLYRLIDGRPYQLVVAPVLAPDPIAWTAMGFALDDKVAADMARLLGVEVSFIAGNDSLPLYVASSRPSEQRENLADVMRGAGGDPFSVRIEDDELLTLTNPIRSANGPLMLVLQQSLASALRPYLQLREWILAIGLGILAVASGLAVLLARSAIRPVDKLIVAVERLEAGDYDTPVPKARTNEFIRLSNAFDTMRGAVAERERIIRHQAMHDSLTGLPTRARMTEVLDELITAKRRESGALAICIVEILQFRNVVGSFGHAAADGVLREVAQRLASDGGMHDRIARIGTDQFLVVLEKFDETSSVRAGDLIGEKLRVPFDYDGVSLQLETRIGVAMFPADAECAADLLQLADLALYRAGETGAGVSAFVRGDDEVHRRRLAILGALRRAIAADELELHYQPKVSLRTGEVVGCEALVRWRHPLKGVIPPSDFIAHAERTGLIRVLTTWVLGTAFRQLHAWQMAGVVLDVAINVSPVDLADPDFADSVAALLAKTGADATHVVLEVTESGAMKDLPNTLRIMEQLRILGIRFSIDDFGTGYSSLAHLKGLPVDEIKIDRSFVKELEKNTADDVILRSTINLGHALNLKVVAEGVEVVAGWDALAQLDCDFVQGYFVSKPLAAADLMTWMDKRQAGPPAAPAQLDPEPISIANRRRDTRRRS
jgi:diguanylate cyclase (GGDEF)-like protein